MDNITVIVVTYCSADCIASLAQCLAKFKHVVFVDNASTDDTRQQIVRQIPQARCIELPENRGFGAANNRAIFEAKTEFVLLVNPDVSFTESAVEQLVSTAARFANAALVGPHVLTKSGRPEGNYRWPRLTWHSSGPLAEAEACTGFISGAFMLGRTELIRAISGFDERFFLYYEDEDLCQRAFDAGHSIIVNPQAEVTHFSRSSVKSSSPLRSEYFRAKHHTLSKFYFETKHNKKFTQAVRMKLLARLWIQALLALGVRLVIPSSKYSAYLGRVLGRLAGLRTLSVNSSH